MVMQSLRRYQMVSQPSRLAVALLGLVVALVQAYPPRALCDMMGGVAQWVADCARSSCAEAPQDGAAWLAGNYPRRLTQGSWPSNWHELASVREAIPADQHRNDTGFRVAKTLRYAAGPGCHDGTSYA
jgi:formylglycine-generating enzyme required for sulfatase activity